MKLFILLLTFVGSFAQASCPDINGTFVLSSGAGAETMTIVKVSNKNKATSYLVNVDGRVSNWVTDNVSRKVLIRNEDGSSITLAEQFLCTSGELEADFLEVHYLPNGEVENGVVGKVNYSLDENSGNLRVETTLVDRANSVVTENTGIYTRQ